MVKNKKCQNNIIFTGKVAWDDMPVYYNMADIFITASTSETQGLTVIEAMAASLPAICIDDESFNMTVVDGLNGYLFTTKEECKNILEKLFKDKKTRNALAKGARDSADKHSAKYFSEQVLDVYKKAIINRKKGLRERFMAFIKGDKK